MPANGLQEQIKMRCSSRLYSLSSAEMVSLLSHQNKETTRTIFFIKQVYPLYFFRTDLLYQNSFSVSSSFLILYFRTSIMCKCRQQTLATSLLHYVTFALFWIWAFNQLKASNLSLKSMLHYITYVWLH